MPGAPNETEDQKTRSMSPPDKRPLEEEDSGDEEDGQSNQGNKYKKLASGKRADQNRKAQRAFRQRKDKYIKDLELRSQELDIANSLIVQLKEENDRLNEIAKSFHSRVGELEAQLEELTSSQASVTQDNNMQYKSESTKENSYYPVRERSSRDQGERIQGYGSSSRVGSIYSQSQGLL